LESLTFFLMFLAGRKKVMQMEQDIPASALVRVYLLGPLDPRGAQRDSIAEQEGKN
jgi:hypothetical protein